MADLYRQNLHTGLTTLGVDCVGVQMALEEVHRKAIDSGLAVKTEDIGKFTLE